MNSASSPSSKLVYVHGTNGSGKSTLARAVMAAAGGANGAPEPLHNNPKASATYTMEGVVLIGKYGNACGGVDGLSPYASIHDLMQHHLSIDDGVRFFAEGLITPGVDTCKTLAGYVDDALFILLDTPVEQCITNVMKRRGRKGTDKPYDPSNLHKKAVTARSWAARLAAAGLRVEVLTWGKAYFRCLDELGLPAPDVDQLL